MILRYITNIGKIYELTLGQGLKIKGQGQIGAYVKNGKKRFKINVLVDVDDTNIYH